MGNKEQKKSELIELVEKAVPQLVKLFKEHKNKYDGISDVPPIVFHQDAFAADYQDEEIMLLGAVVKYAGLYNVRIEFVGMNETALSLEEQQAYVEKLYDIHEVSSE